MLHGAATGILLSTLLAAAPALASGQHDHQHDSSHDHDHDERRQGEVHLHGLGTLNLVLEGETLLVELDGPAANFVGFERAPRTAVENAAVERTLELLAQPAGLLGLPAAARCSEQDIQVRGLEPAPHDDHEHEHDHDHDGEGSDDGHADMGATWEFRCASPAALTAIEVKVFTVFPLTEELTANIIAPGLQTRQVLTPTRSTLNLRR